MIKLLTFDQIEINQWNNLIDHSDTASFFQTPECYHFYASLSFLKPFVFGVSENEKLVGLVCGYLIAEGNFIKKFFSRRAIVPGGLLLSKDCSETALKSLLSGLKNKLRYKTIYIEIRNFNDYSFFKRTIESEKFRYLPHLNFHVQTTNIDSTLAQLHRTKKRYIKLSANEGVEFYISKNSADISAFFEILKNLYLTKIKTPLMPFEFFEKLIQLPFSKMFIVKYKEKVIGGSVCVSFKENILYEWYVCGLDRQFKNVYPSTIATWAALKYSAENGYHYFDMMGAGRPNENYGVRDFKSEFGGKLVEQGRFLFVSKPILYSLGKYVVKIMKSNKYININ
jgi:lipid II:glycine glycyltransferase (peptidoglycan interpeptide bridge formation enzyme)